jgi:hypothetical protein
MKKAAKKNQRAAARKEDWVTVEWWSPNSVRIRGRSLSEAMEQARAAPKGK